MSSLSLHPELLRDLKTYRESLNFRPHLWIAHRADQLANYCKKCGLSALVVSVSGGVDSAVVLALSAYTMKHYPDVIKKVVPVSQPIHSSDWALGRAKEQCEVLGLELKEIDQTKIYDQLRSLVESVMDIKGENFASGQLRSYMRTPTAYYVAQLLSQTGTPAIVMGTGNRDEDEYLAYFCKAGDGVVDVSTIYDLHKSQVFQVGKELGVVESILTAAPSADLWDGQEDEIELGVSYEFVELYTGYFLGKSEEEQQKYRDALECSGDADEQFHEMEAKVKQIHQANSHKLNFPFLIGKDESLEK